MALTRKMLEALGVEEKAVEQIIEAHTEVTSALKAKRDEFEEKAKKFDDVSKELEAIKKDGWKGKYEKEHSDFESYKNSVEKEKSNREKKELFRRLLKEANISDSNNRYEAITKITDLESLELDDKGEIKNKEKLLESLKTDYAGFIVENNKQGANTKTPPANNGSKKENSEIFKKDEKGKYIYSSVERQKMIAENLNERN